MEGGGGDVGGVEGAGGLGDLRVGLEVGEGFYLEVFDLGF